MIVLNDIHQTICLFFCSAEILANKVVPFFTLCSEQLSDQSHYDFGLRSLKSVLVMAGNVKRDKLKALKDEMTAKNQVIDEAKLAEMLPEKEVIFKDIVLYLIIFLSCEIV